MEQDITVFNNKLTYIKSLPYVMKLTPQSNSLRKQRLRVTIFPKVTQPISGSAKIQTQTEFRPTLLYYSVPFKFADFMIIRQNGLGTFFMATS